MKETYNENFIMKKKKQITIDNELAERIYNLSLYNAKKAEAEDVPEFLGYEISTLAEWMCNGFLEARLTASRIIKDYQPHPTAATFLRQYFDLSY